MTFLKISRALFRKSHAARNIPENQSIAWWLRAMPTTL